MSTNGTRSINLAECSDEDFRAIVDQEVRGTLDAETGAALRDPEISDRWYYALVQMKKSVESQLGSKRSDILKQGTLPPNVLADKWADFHRWKAGAVRFKSGVEDRLLELRREKAKLANEENQILRSAILKHRNDVLNEYEPGEVSSADTSLWRSVD